MDSFYIVNNKEAPKLRVGLSIRGLVLTCVESIWMALTVNYEDKDRNDSNVWRGSALLHWKENIVILTKSSSLVAARSLFDNIRVKPAT